MKALGFALLMLVGIKAAGAESLPAQSTIDLYTQIALTHSLEELAGQGSVSCHYGLFYDPSVQAYGNDLIDATQRLALLCIKQECSKLVDKLVESQNKLSSVKESDYATFLQGLGYSSEQVTAALQRKKNFSRSDLEKLGCTNSPQGRMFNADMCFAVPMNCSRR
jgi:hypothetical protein